MKKFLLAQLILLIALVAFIPVDADTGDVTAWRNQDNVEVLRLTQAGVLSPGVTGGAALGSTSLKFSDLYLTAVLDTAGNSTLGDAQTDTLTINAAPTVVDPDGGNATTFNRSVTRLKNNQFLGTGLTNTGYLLIEDGETITDWTATTNVTQTASTTLFRFDLKSLQLAFSAAAVAGNGSAFTISNGNWSGNENVGFWIRSNTALASGDLVVTITDGTAGPTSVNVPAVTTVDTWTFVVVDISGVADASKDDVDGFAVALSSAGATALAAFTVNFDTVIKWDADNDQAITGTSLDGGINMSWKAATAAGTANTMAALVEGTDFWMRPGATSMIIYVTDQSGNTVGFSYQTQ